MLWCNKGTRKPGLIAALREQGFTDKDVDFKKTHRFKLLAMWRDNLHAYHQKWLEELDKKHAEKNATKGT